MRPHFSPRLLLLMMALCAILFAWRRIHRDAKIAQLREPLQQLEVDVQDFRDFRGEEPKVGGTTGFEQHRLPRLIALRQEAKYLEGPYMLRTALMAAIIIAATLVLASWTAKK